MNLPNDHRGFARTACGIGEILASSAGVAQEDAGTVAQWLLPLPGGANFPPEKAEGLQWVKRYDAQIRRMAAAALRSPAALDLVTRWNAVTTPNEAPLRYLTRWTTAAT